MKLSVYPNYRSLSENASDEIIRLVRNRPNATICLASGDTPRLCYQLMVEKATAAKIDFSAISFVGLDEWVGISPENEGSCYFFLENLVLRHLNFSRPNIHLFDGLSDDPARECRKMDEFLHDKGGVDLMIVGVGMNGHIGFNEPGVSFNNYSHLVELDHMTASVGQKYFKEATILKQGITLGLKHLSEATKVLMLANGIKKALVIKKVLEEEISDQMPASIVRTHPNSEVMLDEEAASMLNSRT